MGTRIQRGGDEPEFRSSSLRRRLHGCFRVGQIMNLLNLAPELQEKLLFMPGAASGRDAVTEREMRVVCDVALLERQRRMPAARLQFPSQ